MLLLLAECMSELGRSINQGASIELCVIVALVVDQSNTQPLQWVHLEQRTTRQ
jgi:hypothetical protein